MHPTPWAGFADDDGRGCSPKSAAQRACSIALSGAWRKRLSDWHLFSRFPTRSYPESVRLLLDSNILIPAEPTGLRDVETTTAPAVALQSLLSLGGHTPYVHPKSREEIANGSDSQRAQTRTILLGRYTDLPYPPPLSKTLVEVLGAPRPGSNNEVDLHLLSAVEQNAVDYLVTEDDGIHRRAKRVGLGHRVLTIADALLVVQALFPTVPMAPPLVAALPAHALSAADPIFASFRADYAGFDAWFGKCQREHRQSWVVEGARGYAGVCVVNPESPNNYGFPGKALKICSFKIADEFRGQRYGELLLKTVFSYATENAFEHLFVEVFEKHAELIDLFSDFGFEKKIKSKKGEEVLLKRMIPPPDASDANPLLFNIKYGPHSVSLTGANAFVVPIRPQYHDLLFPEARVGQLELQTSSQPFGNSIRKAYLSHSRLKKMKSGDLLLFYRSVHHQGIGAVGVVEDQLTSTDQDEIARFVARRTVYSYTEIQQMASKPILVVTFRLARILKKRWLTPTLQANKVFARPPQSFMQVSKEGVSWIASQLLESR